MLSLSPSKFFCSAFFCSAFFCFGFLISLLFSLLFFRSAFCLVLFSLPLITSSLLQFFFSSLMLCSIANFFLFSFLFSELSRIYFCWHVTILNLKNSNSPKALPNYSTPFSLLAFFFLFSADCTFKKFPSIFFFLFQHAFFWMSCLPVKNKAREEKKIKNDRFQRDAK